MSGPDFWVGLAVGLGVAGGLSLGLWLYVRSGARRRAETPGRSEGDIDPAVEAVLPVPEPRPDAPHWRGEERGEESAGPADPTTPGEPRPGPPEPAGVEREGATPPGKDEEEPLHLSRRVLVHLLRQGHLAPGIAPEDGHTQRGMGEVLGVRQGALSSVLRRLEDGGAIVSEKMHVRGRDRRVKVYQLTPRGRELAKRVRPSVPPGTGSNPTPSETRR